MGAKNSIPEKIPKPNQPNGDSIEVPNLQPVNRNFTDNRPAFSERQKELVRSTWAIVNQDITRVGVITFIKLFEMHPNLQDVFIPLKGVAKDDLRHNSQLRYHALRVMSAVEKVVSRLEEPDALVKLLHELGARHATYDAKVDYIDLIGPQFIAAIQPSLDNHWNHETEEAWSDLFKLIGHFMKETMTF